MKVARFASAALLVACSTTNEHESPPPLEVDAGVDAAVERYPANIDPQQAVRFKELLESPATAAAIQAMHCRFGARIVHGTEVVQDDVPYTLTVEPMTGVDGQLDRDVSVLFATDQPIVNPDDPSMPIQGGQSMLVAYDLWSHPSLIVEGHHYQYAFSGYLTDLLELTEDLDGRVTDITFRKLFNGENDERTRENTETGG